jgi:hypothetical protein
VRSLAAGGFSVERSRKFRLERNNDPLLRSHDGSKHEGTYAKTRPNDRDQCNIAHGDLVSCSQSREEYIQDEMHEGYPIRCVLLAACVSNSSTRSDDNR